LTRSLASFLLDAAGLDEACPFLLVLVDEIGIVFRRARLISVPSSASCFFTTSDASASRNALLSLSMMGRGVPAGAARP